MTVPPVVVRRPGRGAQPIVLNEVNFTGGLNLTDDQFRLAPGESPDLLNVDVDRDGGFQLRRLVRPLTTDALPERPCFLWAYENPTKSQLMACVFDKLFYYEVGSDEWTDTGLTSSEGVNPMQAVVFNNKGYVTRNAIDPSVSWDGTTATVLTASGAGQWQPVGSPAGGHFPKAKYAAVHNQRVWVANTVEDSVAHPNRVRWSHAGLPEDWDALQYIDVNIGEDGDVIVGIVPFNDHLLVFKRNSVFAIFGYSDDNYQVVPIDLTVGAVQSRAIVNTPTGVYFYSGRDGVHVYRGNSVEWIFENIYPAIRDGRIPSDKNQKVYLGWGNNRLWVSVCWEGSEERDRTFIYDPYVSQMGSWVLYKLRTGPYVEWRRPGLDTVFCSGAVGQARVVKLDQDPSNQSSWADWYGETDGEGDPVFHPIESYYRTRWFDGGEPAVKKRWRRPQLVTRVMHTANPVRVQVFRDYETLQHAKQFFVTPRLESNALVWESSLWDDANWTQNGTADRLLRGSTLGNCNSVQLLFHGPNGPFSWGINAISNIARPRRVRG